MEQEIVDSPKLDAQDAGLVYITDEVRGYTRKKVGEEFAYFDPEGRVVRNQLLLERFRQLVIPPAWKRVWISPVKNSHLQVTGFDARGRKQYRYHKAWIAARNEKKFTRMKLFGELLPVIRERVEKDLRKRNLTREKVLATVVALLDRTLIRIGNKEYARDNKSYGLTTLRTRHVKNLGDKIRFEFRGKRNIERELVITDRKLAGIIRKCKEIPGYELFQYFDQGEKHKVHSGDVNEYLKEISGEDFTAKYFRTWGGSCIAIRALLSFPEETNEKTLKKNITTAIKEVSYHLGNTPAICRNYYVHPIILDHYKEKQLLQLVKDKEHSMSGRKYMDKEEVIFLSILGESNNESSRR